MFDTLLFDLDGTLTNPEEGITKCVQYALKAFNITENNLKNLTCFIGPPLQEAIEEKYNLKREDSEVWMEKYRERFSTVGLFENEVFNGMHELLQALKDKGKILAVATSKPEIYSVKILEKFDLLKYFDCVSGSELDGKRVNKDEVIEEVFRRLGYDDDKRKSSAMVGDRKHDILGAKAANIKSIGVKYGFAEENELEDAGADYIVNDLKELSNLLLN